MTFKIKAIVSAGLLLSGTAFGSSDETREALLSGRLRIENSVFNSAFTGKETTTALLKDERWIELVENVLGKQFSANSYYYLLGRAAEGMGSKKAAVIYYKIALDKKQYTYDCNNYMFGDACFGMKFPDVVTNRHNTLTTPSPSQTMKWLIGEGPTVKEVISSPNVSIAGLLTPTPSPSKKKTKFETEAEFLDRTKKATERLFVSYPLKTDDESHCRTLYDHDKSKYSIAECGIVSSATPALELSGQGETFTLANMMDKREIKRHIKRAFFFDANYAWSSEFHISRESASALDNDLHVGIEFEDFAIKSTCPECKARDRNEDIVGMMESIGALNKRPTNTTSIDWKTDAFRTGHIDESWTHIISLNKISRIIVFRGKDQRILYQITPEL